MKFINHLIKFAIFILFINITYAQCNQDFTYTFSNDTVKFFTNAESGLNYYYDFGDSTGSNQAECYHLYQTQGTYDVCLYISGDCTDTICKTIEVTCTQDLYNYLPTYTVLYPNQDYHFEIADVFQHYEWNYASIHDTTNNIYIPSDSLTVGYNTVHVTVSDTNYTCVLEKDFNIWQYPCQKFYATIIDSFYYWEPISATISYNLCTNQPYTFRASILSSIPTNNGFVQYNDRYYHQEPDSCQYIWDFNDGSPLVYGDTVNHIYTSSGFRKINVTAIDQYGCESRLFTQMFTQVEGGVNTNFAIPFDTISLGDTVNLAASYDSIPVYNNIFYNEKHIEISDESSITNYSIIIIPIDGVITSGSQIKNICLNLVHTYAADVELVLKGPDDCGEVVLMHNHGGISGADFGVPNNNGLGVGYDYCFNENATQTINESGGVQVLPAGDYLPEESFSNLVGCPVHGYWNIAVTDDWAMDGGWMFNWSIEFDSLPEQVAEHTFAQWEGDNINNPANDTTFAIPSSAGMHQYTYTVENEYGCTFDTTIYVFVTDTIYFPNDNHFDSPIDTIQVNINECSYDYYSVDSASIMGYTYIGNTAIVTINVYHDGTYTQYTQQLYVPQTGTYLIEMFFTCADNPGVVVVVTDYINVNVPTSSETLTNSKLKIYPNPAKDKLTVESTEKINFVEILDITGKLILKSSIRKGASLQSININTLDKGIYFIKINNDTLIKFVKE